MKTIQIRERLLNVVATCSLFDNIPREEINELVYSKGKAVRAFENEVLPRKNEKDVPYIYILCKGSTVIYPANNHSRVLRFISVGDAVGVGSLYSDELMNTDIVSAPGESDYIRLDRKAIEYFLTTEYGDTLRSNMINILSERISFLTQRFITSKIGMSDEKVAFYLLSVSKGRDEFKLDINMSDLAILLEIGRASLYRAFYLFKEAGLVERTKSNVKILDRQGLENYH